jgi:hypothetical protein
MLLLMKLFGSRLVPIRAMVVQYFFLFLDLLLASDHSGLACLTSAIRFHFLLVP